jgi:hypothetical protein
MSKLIIKSRYSVIPNDLVNNPEISLRAKGLFAFIQSKPDGWEFSADRISNQTKEGLQAVISALKELEKHGYLIRQKIQNDLGHWGVDYILKENPIDQIPSIGNPSIGNPIIGKPLNNIKKETKKKDIVITKRDEIINRWFEYKRERKNSYTEIGKATLISKWSDKTDEELEEAINYSISNNYQGLFEPQKNKFIPGSRDSKNSTTLRDKPIIPNEWQ